MKNKGTISLLCDSQGGESESHFSLHTQGFCLLLLLLLLILLFWCSTCLLALARVLDLPCLCSTSRLNHFYLLCLYFFLSSVTLFFQRVFFSVLTYHIIECIYVNHNLFFNGIHSFLTFSAPFVTPDHNFNLLKCILPCFWTCLHYLLVQYSTHLVLHYSNTYGLEFTGNSFLLS